MDRIVDNKSSEDVPLHRKRPFGSGLKRKQISFVPAMDGNLNTTEQASSKANPSSNIGELYLSMVLSKNEQHAKPSSNASEEQHPRERVCDVCKLPLATKPGPEGGLDDSKAADIVRYPENSHEASLAHQVCLSHSHPPSALDRSRMGLGYLESYGWDPDARAGLGASQQGITFPLKAKPKNDTLGLGVTVPRDMSKKTKEKVQSLDAGKVRKLAQEDKKRSEKLRRQFFGNPDLEKYLGPGS